MQMNTQKTTIGNVCFLIDKKENKVLLLKRAFDPMKGKYTGVGGKTHFDEDIHRSCSREVKEETGYEVAKLELKAVVKTILDKHHTSWILFVYTCSEYSGEQIDCDEGQLIWVDLDKITEYPLIGFIKELIPHIFQKGAFIESLILHDQHGRVIDKDIHY